MLSSRVKLVITLLLGLVGLFGSPSLAQRKSAGGDVYVRPYTRKDGTFVSGHMRSAPDKVFGNNWSTKGNVNPYTGNDGTLGYPAYGGGALSGYGKSTSSMLPPLTYGTSWRALSKGMSKSQVQSLLGTAVTVDGGYLTYWYYSSSKLGPKVVFDSDNRVYSWDEPRRTQ